MDYSALASEVSGVLDQMGTSVQIGGATYPAVMMDAGGPGALIQPPAGSQRQGVVQARALELILPAEATVEHGTEVKIDGQTWIVFQPFGIRPGGTMVVQQVGVARGFVDPGQLRESVQAYRLQAVEDGRSRTYEREDEPAYDGKAHVSLTGPQQGEHGGQSAVEWDAEVILPAAELAGVSRLEVDWSGRVIEAVATEWASDWSYEWVRIMGVLRD